MKDLIALHIFSYIAIAVLSSLHMESENCEFRTNELIQLGAYERDWKVLLAGLADLNQCDLNHWFQSRLKSMDFFRQKKSSYLNHTDDFTYQWKIIIK